MDHGASSYHRFLAGDDEGLYEIVCAYQDGLMLYLCSLVHDLHTAEDLTEDTFAELAVKRPKYSGKCSFKTWLYTIGRNIAVSWLRRAARMRTVPLEEQTALANEEDLERRCLRDEQKRTVHKALRTLRQEYQAVLYLTFFEGFTNEETAHIMHKSKRQIENLLYNAKKSLRSALEKEGFRYEEL